MRQTLLFGLISGLLATSIGCTACGGLNCGPTLPGPVCTSGSDCGAMGSACGTCDDGCGDTCGATAGCNSCGPQCGPLTPLFALLSHGCYFGPSCGEIWWGDFHSAPPACDEPCDSCNNWTGQGTMSPSSGCNCSHDDSMVGSVAYQQPQATSTRPQVNYSLPPGAQFISESDQIVVPAQVKHQIPAQPVSQAMRTNHTVIRR